MSALSTPKAWCIFLLCKFFSLYQTFWLISEQFALTSHDLQAQKDAQLGIYICMYTFGKLLSDKLAFLFWCVFLSDLSSGSGTYHFRNESVIELVWTSLSYLDHNVFREVTCWLSYSRITSYFSQDAPLAQKWRGAPTYLFNWGCWFDLLLLTFAVRFYFESDYVNDANSHPVTFMAI